jgi:hypothetical protein
MVRLQLSLALIFLGLFILNASASNINTTYLNPSYQNDWGFIEIAQFTAALTHQNPGLSVFNTEMNDISINYIYDFDFNDPVLKKDIESIKKINDDYQKLQSDRRMVIDKAFQFTSLSIGAAVLGLASLTVSFPISAGFILTEMGALGYLLFDLVDDTFAYYANYIELVRVASNNYNSLLYKVERNNIDLINMGITNNNYRGYSVNDYSQTIYLINSINSNSLISREEDMKKDLNDKLIIFDYTKILHNLNSQYYDLVHSHNSAYYKLINAYVLQEKIKKNLIDENNLLNTESENLRKKTFDKLKFSTENFYGIDEYYIIKFSLTSVEFAVTPREHVNIASKYYEEALYEIETAKKILNMKNENYLVESTIHFDKAINLLVKSDIELSVAELKANKISSQGSGNVLKKYEEAVIKYDSFIPLSDIDLKNKELAKNYLEDSKKLIDSKGTVSEKLYHYLVADSKIDSALAHLNPSNVFNDNVREDVKKSLDYLEKIINLAKKDNVDVSYEELFLKNSRILLKNPNSDVLELLEISNEVISLSNNIYDKAKIQYLHLDSSFISIRNVLLLLNSYDPSLNYKEFNYLNGFYSENGFDKYSSLGNYLEINSNLQILENKINFDKKKIIESILVFNSFTSSNYYSLVELDVPSKLVVTFTTSFYDTSLDYDGAVKFDIPFSYDPYSANSIDKTEDISFSYNNKKLSILINKFDFSKVYSFSLNYDKIFAKTLNVKYSSVPISSTLVQINIEREIENNAISSLKFNKTNVIEPVDLYLNGEYYGRFNERTIMINRPLNSGKNKLTESYLFYNPISYSINEVSTGETKRIKVNVRNLLPFEIKNQPLIVDLPILTPKSYRFMENTCKVNKEGFKLTSTSENSKVYFISDYVQNGQCSFIIEVEGEYNKDKLREEIDSLLNQTDNSKAKDLLDKAKNNIGSEKINDALINIEKAKELIESDLLKNKENLFLESEYNKTRDDLVNLINELSKIENKRVSDIVARAEKNVNEAETLTDMNRKMLKLVAAQSEIDKLRGIGIDLKLKMMNDLNKVIEQWMGFVNIGFKEFVPPHLQDNLIVLNSIDFTEISSRDFEILFEIENELNNYQRELTGLNNNKKDWESELSISYKQLNTQLSNLIKSVENACGNECPSDMISIAKSNLNLKPNNAYSYSIANSKMDESIKQLSAYLENEKTITLRAFEDAKLFVSKITNEDERRAYLRKLNDIQSKINAGNYLVAKRESILLTNMIYGEDMTSFMENSNLLLLGAGLGAILLAFILIKIKTQSNIQSNGEEYKSLRKNEDNKNDDLD